MHLVIDSREDTPRICNILSLHEEISYEIKQLKLGDFVLNNKVYFERKTLSDFVISIKEGRLFRQVYKTVNKNLSYILILEGTKNEISGNRMSREAIQGVLVHLSVFLGIPILRSKNLEETISLIIPAGNQIDKSSCTPNRRTYVKHQKAGKGNINKIQVQVLQNMPGIGHHKAMELLKKLGSLKKVLNASENELLSVSGISKEAAKAILNVMRE
ncbi:MAG: ERCC4 domain-containing protein [Bacteroidales bacterium]